MDKSVAATVSSSYENPTLIEATGVQKDAIVNPAVVVQVDKPNTSTVAATTSSEVRALSLDEYKEAAASLAEAFAEDHTSLYFIETPDRAHWSSEQKWELHAQIMEYITYAHLLKGLVVSAGPNYDCVGLW